MEDKKIKMIIFKVNSEFHKEIKIRATNNNITIKKWILQAILEKIAWEKKAE